MKRTTTLLCALLLAAGLFAQEEMGGFGIHIAYTSPIMRLNSPSSKALEAIPMNGVKVGVNYDATIVKGFGTTLGLNYTYATYNSGWKYINSEMSTDQASYRDTYHGVEIFCDWQYKFQIAGDTYLMLYTGPTIQFAISLTEQDYIRTGTETKKETYYGRTYRDDTGDFKRLNVTWGVGAGFQYKRYFLRGGYDFGLFNPYKSDQFPEQADGTKPWTAGRFDQWQIKIGMYLWRN